MTILIAEERSARRPLFIGVSMFIDYHVYTKTLCFMLSLCHLTENDQPPCAVKRCQIQVSDTAHIDIIEG